MELEVRRNKFREDYLHPRYSGHAHFAFTTFACVGAVAIAFSLLSAWSAEFVVWIFLFLIFNSLLEYLSHRFHQHQKNPLVSFLYKFHTLEHHQLFHHDNMSVGSSKDYYMILFPPSVTLLLLLIWFPMVSGVIWLTGYSDVAILYYVSSVLGYYLYELVHLSAHQKENSVFSRWPFISGLVENHRVHHNPAHMAKGNFGIVTTVWDHLFRTKV